MNDLLGLIGAIIVVLIFGVSLAALVVVCRLVFPQLTARTYHYTLHMPRRSFAVGLVNVVFFGLLAAALASIGPVGRLLGGIIVTGVLGLVAIGLTAAARLVGERLQPAEPDSIRQLLAGIGTLQLAALVPIVGWFGVTLLAGLVGYGAAVISLLLRPVLDPSPGDFPPDMPSSERRRS